MRVWYIFAALLFALGLGLIPAWGQTPPQIEWEVRNPFRFFLPDKDGGPSVFYQMHKQAYDAVNKNGHGSRAEGNASKPISEVEKLLNNAENLQYGDPKDSWLRKFYKTQKSGPLAKANDPIRGWAKYIVTEGQDCWDTLKQLHSNCEDYVNPKFHDVRVFIANGNSNDKCEWRSENSMLYENNIDRANIVTKKVISLGCDKSIYAAVPYRKGDGSADIFLKLNNNEEIQKNIEVTDYLIVGLGDSIAAGEGNPDSPALMELKGYKKVFAGNLVPFVISDDGKEIKKASEDERFRSKKGNFAVSMTSRRGGSVDGRDYGAHWLDRNCHRSLYSYQLRIALQKSLEAGKHAAVTYLGYGCSGAKIDEGLLLEYNGKENIDTSKMDKNSKNRRKAPQIARLIEELCEKRNSPKNIPVELQKTEKNEKTKKITPVLKPHSVKLPGCIKYAREIDLLMLSIGINDINYAGIVMNATLPDKNRENANALARIYKVVKAVVPGENPAADIPANLNTFFNVLKATGIKVKEKSGIPNVIIPAYPNGGANNRDKKICGTNNWESFHGMTATHEFLTINKMKIGKAKEAVSSLNEAFSAHNNYSFLKKFIFARSTEDLFKINGICAGLPSPKGLASKHLLRNFMQVPIYVSSGTTDSNRWEWGMSGYDWPCYASRDRWMRTFDDAYLCSNTWSEGHYPTGPNRRLNAVDIAMLTLGGPAHPTAEGQAHFADAVWKVIVERGLLK